MHIVFLSSLVKGDENRLKNKITKDSQKSKSIDNFRNLSKKNRIRRIHSQPLVVNIKKCKKIFNKIFKIALTN